MREEHMNITMIGGGSVQWTPILVSDIARTPELAGANLVLHDIDPTALELLKRACQRIVNEIGAQITVTATTDRTEALKGADYVILCVGLGGLKAMRHEIEIPQRYGITQSVGDTVGPGGISRGLRHIPFAVQVAREMEQLCPDAWLLNLTNPMTTICRGITRATKIRTIGLCHEVGGLQRTLSYMLDVPYEQIELSVAGINHLPVILGFTVAGRDGFSALKGWLSVNGVNGLLNRNPSDPLMDPFTDRLALKFSLFEQLGVLFGAGDRHVAEFFPDLLTEATEFGMRYGIRLTTIELRQRLAEQRRAQISAFVEGESEPPPRSSEQLAGVIAALSGRAPGRFVVNVPNQGQISSLPLDVTVECVAEVDTMGVRPLAVGPLPLAAQALIAGHVARQELVVEAALTGRRAPALAALSTDPMLRDIADAPALLDELLAANDIQLT